MIGVFVIFVATNGAVGAGETLPVGRCGQEVVFSSGLGDGGGAVALVTSLTTADEWAWRTHLYKWNADCVFALLSQAELVSSQYEAQRVALETMALRLSSQQYPASANRGQCTQYATNNR